LVETGFICNCIIFMSFTRSQNLDCKINHTDRCCVPQTSHLVSLNHTERCVPQTSRIANLNHTERCVPQTSHIASLGELETLSVYLVISPNTDNTDNILLFEWQMQGENLVCPNIKSELNTVKLG